MAPFRAEVPRAVKAPTDMIERPRPGQDWFYLLLLFTRRHRIRQRQVGHLTAYIHP
jgi:hypothetical protein